MVARAHLRSDRTPRSSGWTQLVLRAGSLLLFRVFTPDAGEDAGHTLRITAAPLLCINGLVKVQQSYSKLKLDSLKAIVKAVISFAENIRGGCARDPSEFIENLVKGGEPLMVPFSDRLQEAHPLRTFLARVSKRRPDWYCGETSSLFLCDKQQMQHAERLLFLGLVSGWVTESFGQGFFLKDSEDVNGQVTRGLWEMVQTVTRHEPYFFKGLTHWESKLFLLLNWAKQCSQITVNAGEHRGEGALAHDRVKRAITLALRAFEANPNTDERLLIAKVQRLITSKRSAKPDPRVQLQVRDDDDTSSTGAPSSHTRRAAVVQIPCEGGSHHPSHKGEGETQERRNSIGAQLEGAAEAAPQQVLQGDAESEPMSASRGVSETRREYDLPEFQKAMMELSRQYVQAQVESRCSHSPLVKRELLGLDAMDTS